MNPKPKPAEGERADQLTFEQSLEKLEQVVQLLEEGQLGLSDALLRYEQGVQHLKHCYGALQQAERKIELLAGIDPQGNPVTEPFDDQALSLEEKAASRTRRRSRSPSVSPDPPRNDLDASDELF